MICFWLAVVKEAASKKKYNLFTESKYNFSVSSLSFTPPGSAPSSPGHLHTSQSQRTPLPPSPLLGNGMTANKSVTVHSLNSESSTLSQALPAMEKIDEGENKTLLEEGSDDVFAIAETSTSNTSTETKPELITTTIAMDVIPTPVIEVTEATESAGTSSPPKGELFSDFANKPTVAISPICMKTSGFGGDPAETENNSKVAVLPDDQAQIKAPMRDESTYPIAVCLSIEDVEAGDIYKEFTDEQIINLPEKASESQSSPCLEDETRPLGCVKEIRDLVMEVIEIEEVIQPCKDNGEKVQMFEEPEAIV